MYSTERQRMMSMMVMITRKREKENLTNQLREKQMSRKAKRKETNIFKHSVAK